MEVFERLIWYPDEMDEVSFEAEVYHLNSEINESNAELYGRYLESVTSNPFVANEFAREARDQSYLSNVQLPSVSDIDRSLSDCLMSRTSSARTARGELSTVEVASLLKYSLGHTRTVDGRDHFANPSAGGLYSCSGYCAVLSAKDIDPGLYHYNPKLHSLEMRRLGDFRDFLTRTVFTDGLAAKLSLFFIITIDLNRVFLKYGDRGYRYALMECGHIGQNMALTAAGLGLACTPFGGFFDCELNDFLELTSREHAAYVIGLGRMAA